MEKHDPKPNKWIKYGPVKWKKVEESEVVEAKNHGGLDDWFGKEKWVDVSRPKKDGKWQPCGRGDTSKGKKPVCTPVNKAKGLSEKERKNRVRQKRQKEKEPNPDKKPNVTKYTEQAGGKSNVSNSNWRLVKIAQSDSSFDYKNERLYEGLSEKGQQYVDQKNAENSITSYLELDAAIAKAFEEGLGDMMFPSKSEKFKKEFKNVDKGFLEYICGLWLINRGLFDNQQYSGFSSPGLLKVLVKSMDVKRFVFGDTVRYSINPNTPHQRYYLKLKDFIRSESPNFDVSGADTEIDTIMHFLTRVDHFDRGFKEEAENLIKEGQELYRTVQSDPDALPIF